MKLIECVPNISEGRDRAIIDAVTAEISDTEGAVLLDVDPGEATNRTVITFAGPPEAVVEATFRAIRRASMLIDMSKHSGEHARFGATDVCPFVPMQGATMEDCVELAKELGRRVGEDRHPSPWARRLRSSQWLLPPPPRNSTPPGQPSRPATWSPRRRDT